MADTAVIPPDVLAAMQADVDAEGERYEQELLTEFAGKADAPSAPIARTDNSCTCMACFRHQVACGQCMVCRALL